MIKPFWGDSLTKPRNLIRVSDCWALFEVLTATNHIWADEPAGKGRYNLHQCNSTSNASKIPIFPYIHLMFPCVPKSTARMFHLVASSKHIDIFENSSTLPIDFTNFAHIPKCLPKCLPKIRWFKSKLRELWIFSHQNLHPGNNLHSQTGEFALFSPKKNLHLKTKKAPLFHLEVLPKKKRL